MQLRTFFQIADVKIEKPIGINYFITYSPPEYNVKFIKFHQNKSQSFFKRMYSAFGMLI